MHVCDAWLHFARRNARLLAKTTISQRFEERLHVQSFRNVEQRSLTLWHQKSSRGLGFRGAVVNMIEQGVSVSGGPV